ncbi:MAG TPA: 3'-5' exonuclease, partial [Acidobacteriaceae bacterium]
AEMRSRVILALEAAAAGPPAAGEALTTALARGALARSEERGWELLQQPHRLDVQTIDSLCLRLAHGQPLLARLGGQLAPTEQAGPLHALAARRTMARLGGDRPLLDTALRQLLLLRDNNLRGCEGLIARMLARREQWGHVLPLGEQASVDWAAVRAQLEAPFAAEVARALQAVHAEFAAMPILASELPVLAQYACNNSSKLEIDLLDSMPGLPPGHPDFLEHWRCVRSLLLTKAGEWRRRYGRSEGFPPTVKSAFSYGERMLGLVRDLQRDPAAGERLRELLSSLSSLPDARYDETQWQTLRSVFEVLRHAVAELHVVFAERNEVDFAEISIAAAAVLEDETNPAALLAAESRLHLLIDEFQDTSRAQHQLIGRLLREWQPGEGHTCFLVGDPMQSIYIFRQAEVELFGRVQRRGIDCGNHRHPCSGLVLRENFRSHAGLVDPLNAYFTRIFAGSADAPGEVTFAPSNASAPARGRDSVQVHSFFSASGNEEEVAAAQQAEIDRVVALVEQERASLGQLGAERARGHTIAILGRAKNHLVRIAGALRAKGIVFRAIELETLAERQEILDLLSLLRALLHPGDRVAWLSVLRAPWCGLRLGDLHLLTGADEEPFRGMPVPELMADRASLLTDDGQARLARVAAVLARAASERFRLGQTPSQWLERSWVSLGAPAYLRDEERENAEAFFRLLDGLPPDRLDLLQAALGRLCAAPDPRAEETSGVQLMTIHKAKGLGFDVVIVPALERATGRDEFPLVTMLERARKESEAGEERDELLVAPLGRHGEQHPTYAWVQKQRGERATAEHKRLFYVACTRARERLHLLGRATVSSSGRVQASAAGSLLASAWPALGPLFEHRWQEQAAGRSASGAEAGAPETPVREGWVAKLAAGSAAPSELRLRRVPAQFQPRTALENVTAPGTFMKGSVAERGQPGAERFRRPEGSFEQRARGNAVHAMLQLVSEAWSRKGAAADPLQLEPELGRLTRSVLRRAGLGAARVESLAPVLVGTVLSAAGHAEGRWILSPHPEAQSEASWSHRSGSEAPRSLRVDRVFRAGAEPLSEGSQALWVIDYKTGSDPGPLMLDAYLEGQKEQWKPQLEAYGAALRAFYGPRLQLRYGLYFPELLRLKSWSG